MKTGFRRTPARGTRRGCRWPRSVRPPPTGPGRRRGRGLGAVLADGPGIKEKHLDVEQQEDDGDQVVTNIEPLAGIADRVHARLVRHLLDRVVFFGPRIALEVSIAIAVHDGNQDEQEHRGEFDSHAGRSRRVGEVLREEFHNVVAKQIRPGGSEVSRLRWTRSYDRITGPQGGSGPNQVRGPLGSLQTDCRKRRRDRQSRPEKPGRLPGDAISEGRGWGPCWDRWWPGRRAEHV